MLYHTLMNSDDERVAKKVIEEQENKQIDGCWFYETKEEAAAIGVVLKKDVVTVKTKPQWKDEVKTAVTREYERLCEEKISSMTKLRFLGEVKACNSYMQTVHNEDYTTAMKIRLNMMDMVTKNFGGRDNCILCGEADSTEHIMECNGVEGEIGMAALRTGEGMDKVVKRFVEVEKERRTLMTTNIINYLTEGHMGRDI